MKRALLLLLFPALLHAAEHDHSPSTKEDGLVPPQPAAEADHSAHDPEDAGLVTPEPTAEADAAHTGSAGTVTQGTQALLSLDSGEALMLDPAAHSDHLMSDHGATLNFLVLGERFEQSDDDTQQWELQGWLGYDRDKLWLKTEGEYDTAANATDYSELQVLYSRAIAPYWDLQAGLRHSDGPNTHAHAVIGLMGLAPYWFEIDAAAFIGEHGDVSARVEAEYELRFTQRLLLQPRLELNYGFADDPALAIGEGMSEASLGLRLRYEWRRELAPYVGVEWSRAYGGTADLLRATGANRAETRVVAGLRFWY